LENQRKRESLGNCFDLHFYFILEFFPSVFLCDLFLKHLVFSHLSYQLYPIYRILICEENWSVVYCDHQGYLWSLWSPRVLIFLCFGFVVIPLSVEVIVEEIWVVGIPLSVEAIVVEFGFVPIPLVWGDCGCLAQCLFPLVWGDSCCALPLV